MGLYQQDGQIGIPRPPPTLTEMLIQQCTGQFGEKYRNQLRPPKLQVSMKPNTLKQIEKFIALTSLSPPPSSVWWDWGKKKTAIASPWKGKKLEHASNVLGLVVPSKGMVSVLPMLRALTGQSIL